MATYQQNIVPPGFPYPTPVPNARSRFVELLNKHGLPINTFINEEMEIGVNDLTNLDHSRFVELCAFFKLNPIQKIRFEKLVNELSDGEEHFNPLKAKSIDTYNHNKTIPTSHNESLIISTLDDEYEKVQCISQLAEFMTTRTTDRCSKCLEQINKIFESQKESIVNILENRKQELQTNIHQFQEKQLIYIQSYVKDIDEYTANIRETRTAISECLHSQPFGEDREDNIHQIIQSLMSPHAKHASYRNPSELNQNLGEMGKEIKIEYEPMMIQTCLNQMFILESTINDDVQAKLNDINRLSNQISINSNPSISHSQIQSPHQSPHNNQMNQPQYGHNQGLAINGQQQGISRPTRGASFEDRFGGHSPNANNPNFNGNGYHFASQSMYQLKSHRSADMFEENVNNYSNPNQNPNNLSSPLHTNARSASFSQLQSLSPNPPPTNSNHHLFGASRPTKRGSFDQYVHFNDPHNNYGNPQQQSQQLPTQPPMRNRPHSFAYNDQSYVPLFNAGAKSNPLLSNHNQQPGHARNGSSPALGSVQKNNNKQRTDNNNGGVMSPLSIPNNNDKYYPQSQQQSQAKPRQQSGGGIHRYSPPFGPQQANNSHHSPPFGSKINVPLPYSPPSNMMLNGNKNINNNSTFSQLPPSNSPPLSFQQLPITGYSNNNNQNMMNSHSNLNGNRSHSVYNNGNVNNTINDKNNRSHSVYNNGNYSRSNNNNNNNNNNNGNNQIHPIQMQSSNSNHSHHSRSGNSRNSNGSANAQARVTSGHSHAPSNGSSHPAVVANGHPPVLIERNSHPPVLSQSESGQENEQDIQALVQETEELKLDEGGDHDPDHEREHSIEAMFEPGKPPPSTPNDYYGATPQNGHGHGPAANNNNHSNQAKPQTLSLNKKALHLNDPSGALNGNFGSIDITNPDYLDCNPIEILQDYKQKEEDEANGKSPYMDSIAVSIDQNRRISNNSHNSALGSSPAASRSRPTSQVSAASSHYSAKWAIYAVGNNMSYEFGLNHNNNISVFQQMNWNIDESQFSNVSDAIGDIHDEEEEKKEVIDDDALLENITADGVVWNKKIWNDCLSSVTNGPGWHIYLFGGGGLYCAGSNASGCFSMGKEKKGTYVQTLTQHSYFRDNQVNITYLSSGSTGHHAFVIDDQDDIYAMGEGSNYQLALDNEQVAKNKENYWPMKIHFFENMQLKICRIACGKKFSIFISEGGATWSCGYNVFGALGWGDEISTLKQPKLIERLIKTKAKDAVCGENHSVILDLSGRLWTFGINNQGQLGRKTANNLDYPKIVDIHSRKLSLGQSHTRIKKIASGANHVGVITESNKAFVWGANDKGQLGDGTQKMRNRPQKILKGEQIRDLQLGTNHTVIISKKRKVWVCGHNEYHQCQDQKNTGKDKDKKHHKRLNSNQNVILKPRVLTFENNPDIDQQIKQIFAGHNSTFVAVDTSMEILRVCV